MYDDVPFTARPIDRWPGELTRNRRRSPFSASWSSTMATLHLELRHLQARNIVLQLAVTESDIRLDGRPRARAVASHPGVVLAFDSRHGPLKYAVDTFDRWQDNLRAIALALDALRRVDRYGVVKRGEQYTGWRQIEQHTGHGFASADAAADWITDQINGTAGAGWTPADALANPDDAYHILARRLHPDAPTGSHEQFVKLQQAIAVVIGAP